MSLKAALAHLCPSLDGNSNAGSDSTNKWVCANDNTHCCADLPLISSSGQVFHCHKGLMRARCPTLPPANCDGAVEVDEDASVIHSMLHWVYCETLSGEKNSNLAVGRKLLKLAEAWGLRDFSVLRDRLIGSWRTERREGTLAKDLVHAYDRNELGNDFFIKVCEDGGELELLPGGWIELLRSQSSYFQSMFSGSWAESRGDVAIHYPKLRLAKLLRFLHGHPFVTGSGDLMDAVECGSFFGVPSLLAHANDWIAANLKVTNAASLWCFLETESRLCLRDLDGQWYAADADDSCFDFHIRHFEELARDPDDGDGSWVPLHDLSFSLMRRLLASGLVAMPRDALTEVVERFVEAKFGYKDRAALKELRPPAVLFNREIRSMLMGATEASIRTVL